MSSEGLPTESSAELCVIILFSIFKAVAVIAASSHVRVAEETYGCLHRYSCIRHLYMQFFCYFLTLPKAVSHFENHLCWKQPRHPVPTKPPAGNNLPSLPGPLGLLSWAFFSSLPPQSFSFSLPLSSTHPFCSAKVPVSINKIYVTFQNYIPSAVHPTFSISGRKLSGG